MAFLDLVIYDDRGDSRFPGTLIRPRCADPVEGKRDFLAQVLQEGGEGIILKHQQGIYVSGKRTREQYKLKKYGTIDCFVTGYVPGEGELTGMVGALKVSVIVNHDAVHEVAAITPGTLGFRHQISAENGSLKPEWYGKVVSVHFMEWTINNRLRHAVLLGFQEEKTKDDCIIHALGEIK
jgi:ATP-dependent DNA ligase